MTRSGIQHPDVVDLISQATDGTVRLILAEVDPLTGHQVVALQRKLANYLSEFLRAFRILALRKGVDLEVSINQEMVIL